MMLDATQNYTTPLSEERLFGWHSALFRTGRSGMHRIIVGDWRDDAKGPMQVVSGPEGKEKTTCSHDTALREIQALIGSGVLQQGPAGGRSTSYSLVF